jgi:hypothetical protein
VRFPESQVPTYGPVHGDAAVQSQVGSLLAFRSTRSHLGAELHERTLRLFGGATRIVYNLCESVLGCQISEMPILR